MEAFCETKNAFLLTELTRGILSRQICILLWSITLLLFSPYLNVFLGVVAKERSGEPTG